MMHKLFIIFPLIFISACSTTTGIKIETNTIVIKPSNSLYNCPQLGRLPDPETLTNKQVADTIVKLMRNNKTCNINMKAIQKYISDAEAAINKEK